MRQSQSSPGSEARKAALVFAVATLVLAFSWLLGLSLRVNIFTVNIEAIRVAGIRRVIEGTTGTFAGFCLLFVLITAMYLLAAYALRKEFHRSFALAIGGCVVAALGVLPQMPIASPDTVHFAADVRTLWIHGVYPATKRGAPQRQDDPVAKQVLTYRDQPSTYGPVAYVIGGLPIPVAGESLRAGVVGQKMLSGALLVVVAFLTGLVARKIGRNASQAAVLVGLNPLFLLEFTGDGHNDTLMVAFAMAALLFVVSVRWRDRGLGAGLAVLSLFSKFSLGLAAPIVLAGWFPRWRIPLAVGTVVLGVLALIVLLGRGGSSPLVGLTENTPYVMINQWFIQSRDSRRLLVAAAYMGIAVTSALIMVRHPLREPRDIVAAVGLQLALFVFFFSPTLRHWYQLWAFPFAILCGRRWLTAGALAFSCGALYPILVRNWVLDIQNDWGIGAPKEWSIALLWMATIAVAATVWIIDRNGGVRESSASRAGRRRGRPQTPPVQPGRRRKPRRGRAGVRVALPGRGELS